ncbi:MAG TPA: hypothetical protein VE988_12160 [Gemmataceae bacterium]|nr:hypothetical protein [Gemmataceae bacterium]
MFTKCEEYTPEIDQAFAIQTKCFDRGSSNRRDANDMRGLLGPGEVVGPALAPWVEQGNHFTRDEVSSRTFVVFVVVASLAGPGEVFDLGFA